ncbi:MAG: archease [Chloroflexi bacterium]|nr:archease [Chloroflexota bacterium]MBU1751902.1 archease [Chloroflexota bacterium]
MRDAGYQSLDHTADVSLRVWAPTLPALFEQAARGMMAQMLDVSAVPLTQRRRVCVTALDRESLLVEWLNELLYRREVDGETLVRACVVRLSDTELEAEVEGGVAASAGVFHPIKAATYHDLVVREVPAGYAATIVFDV